MSTVLDVHDMNVSYHGHTALDRVSFSVSQPQLVGIVGPNGAGKSTMIKAILGLIPVNQGEITIFGQPVNDVRKHIAYVPQRNIIDFDFPILVQDVVVMGRYPHLPWWKRPTKNDRQLALTCLEQVGMQDYARTQIGELSGGQQQRVFLARALAQEAELFFLDEPFAGIDVTSESIIIQLLRNLQQSGKTVFVVHHDLSKVEQYFDQLLLLNKTVNGFGPTSEVFDVENLSRTYGQQMAVVSSAEGAMVIGG